MSDQMTLKPLSVADVFSFSTMRVYNCDGDLVLTTGDGIRNSMIHLYENEVEGRAMYSLNLGAAVELLQRPIFIGKVDGLEVSYAISETAYDFKSMHLSAVDGSVMRIKRNDDSFPEPTFSQQD